MRGQEIAPWVVSGCEAMVSHPHEGSGGDLAGRARRRSRGSHPHEGSGDQAPVEFQLLLR